MTRNRPKVGHLMRRLTCVICAHEFTQRRAGRPRLSCSPACAAKRASLRAAQPYRRAPCQACGRRHEPELCGSGYRYCPRTEMHFKPAEQLELLGNVGEHHGQAQEAHRIR